MLRAAKVGSQHLQVTARGSGVADALKKDIEVVPDGRRVEQVFNGTLGNPASMTLTVPADAIEGSPKAIVKIYPSNFSQLVEGLDGIFRMPYWPFQLANFFSAFLWAFVLLTVGDIVGAIIRWVWS